MRLITNATGARLDYVTVRVNRTTELTFSQQTTGANYRIELKYMDTADPSTAALDEWTVTEGSATYNASASSQAAIFSGPTLIGHEFKLALKLGFQAKQAADPTNSTMGGYATWTPGTRRLRPPTELMPPRNRPPTRGSTWSSESLCTPS